MEKKDSAILLQKQIRDNSEDLQKEFLDMQAWAEQMKKKDLEMRSLKNDQVLPPIRSKKKKKTSPGPEVSKDEKPSKTKRIGGFDYRSWDKFDVDKACEEVDVNDDSAKAAEETVIEIPTKKELEKERAEAIKFKEEGNALVQKREYAKAVGKYSEAIKIFPHDAVFYANRALCQLKLDNLYSAESDCTEAIKLNPNYVKAYHRRAQARMELKRYKDALPDLEMMIKLDPSNKEAKSLRTQVQMKIEKSSKTMIISGGDKGEKSSVEKKIGEKLLEKPVTPQDNVNQAQASTSKDARSNSLENKTDETNKHVKAFENNSPNIEKSSSLTESKETEVIDDILPPWLPKLKEGIDIIEPLTEVPRQQKQTLKRVLVKEMPVNESIFKDVIQEVNKEITEQPVIKNDSGPEDKTNINKVTENKTESNDKNDKQVNESLPPPPKSAVGFLINWRKNISTDFRHKYLKQIVPEDLPGIFKDSMESNIFSEILSILNTKFIPNNDTVYNYLYHLSKVKRFRALILFMTKADKEVLKSLFEHCKTKEDKTVEEVNDLYTAYEM